MSLEIKKLLHGNKHFRKKFFNPKSIIFDELVLYGQQPKTMVIACADARVDPAMIFNCQPGELFVIRNIANLVPPCESSDTYHGTSAALEFGVCFLKIQHIVILGHTQCGGIQTLLQSANQVLDKQSHGFIAKWMELAQPAYERILAEHAQVPLAEQVTLCEQYALVNSLNNLQSFPWIRERIQSGKLELHAWYFDLATGQIYAYDESGNHWNSAE